MKGVISGKAVFVFFLYLFTIFGCKNASHQEEVPDEAFEQLARDLAALEQEINQFKNRIEDNE